MLCYWIVLYNMHVRPTAFCLGGPFSPDTLYLFIVSAQTIANLLLRYSKPFDNETYTVEGVF